MPAPTFTNLTGSGASSATSFATASISPTGSRLILVSIHAYISTGSAQPAQPTVTGNGITYELVRAQNVDAAGTDRATLFTFRGMAASPSAGAITIDFGAVTMTRCQWSVDQSDANVDTSGTNGSGAVVQTTGVTTASGATSGSVNYPVAMTAGNSGFSAWGHQVQEAKTPRASWTELADVTVVTLASVETQYIAATDTAGSASWTTGSRAGGVIVEVKASAGTTPVGKDLALQWDTRAALGDIVQAIWDVREAVGDPAALQWDVRALATKSVQAVWDVRAAVGDTVQLVWDVQSALAAVGKDLGLVWDVRSTLGDPLQVVWDTRALIGDTVQMVWDLRSVVADESVLRWDIRTATGDTVQAVWDVRAAVGDAVQLVWDVESSLVVVTPTGRTLTVPLETRVEIVASESRTFTVPLEIRANTVASESRTFTIPLETRTMEV